MLDVVLCVEPSVPAIPFWPVEVVPIDPPAPVPPEPLFVPAIPDAILIVGKLV